MQSALDVGQNSAYSQLQTALKERELDGVGRLRDAAPVHGLLGTEVEEDAQVDGQRRSATVSDGHGTFAALEFEPISQLTYPATPGEFLPRKGLGIILVVLSVLVVC